MAMGGELTDRNALAKHMQKKGGAGPCRDLPNSMQVVFAQYGRNFNGS